MIVDMHTHLYPLKYVEWFNKHEIVPALWQTDPIEPGFSSVQALIESMDSSGVTTSVITSGNMPWVDVLKPENAVDLARLLNDEIAAYVKMYPDKLVGFANLPFVAPSDAVNELKRAVKELGLRGVFLPSNIAGRPVDSAELIPVYAEISKLGVPIFLHPAVPETAVNMTDYRLILTLGFTCNTALAISRLILSGIMEKYPLKIVAAHAGGVFPYVIGRIARAYEMWPDEVGRNISKNPREYLRNIYVDHVSFNVPSAVCARDTVGIERLVFGSDYPFGWGTQADFVKYANELPFSEEEKNRLLWKNAGSLLDL
jgi:aminocarboxymuconate-semialdehyde decarboxylase